MGREPAWVKELRRSGEWHEAMEKNDKKKIKEIMEQGKKEYEEGRKKFVDKLRAAEARKAAKEKEKAETTKKSTVKKTVVKKIVKKPVADKKPATKKKA